MFDSQARLVGLTTLYIDGGQNLNFAMPVEWLAQIKPGKKAASTQRSQVDWIIRAVALEEKKDWSRQLDWGKQWVKAEPGNAGALFAIGAAHQGLNQHEQAIATYRQVLRIDPEVAAVWHNLGIAYADLKRYDDAIAAHRQVLRINPEDAGAWVRRVVSYYATGNTTAALQAVKALRLLDPAKAEMLFNVIVPR